MKGPIAALAEYGRGRQLPPPCYRWRRIDWVLDITGDLTNPRLVVTAYGETDAVPVIRRSGTNPMPLLAVDTATYVLGASGPPAPGSKGATVTATRATTCATAWWQQLAAWTAGPNTHPAAGVALALATAAGGATADTRVSPRDRVAVRVHGVWLHRLPEAVAEWEQVVARLKTGPAGLCVGCGQHRPLLESMPVPIPANLVPGADKDVQLVVRDPADRKPGATLPLCLPCGDTAAHALELLLTEGRATAMAGQNGVFAAFGLGTAGADEEVAGLVRMLFGH